MDGSSLVAGLLAAGAALAFLLAALDPRGAAESAFAATFLCLVAAACCGPFLMDGLRSGLLRSLYLGLLAAAVIGIAGGPLPGAIACGLFCGLYAFALAALSDLLRGRAAAVALALLGVALLFTLHYWDGLVHLKTADRLASAAWAFRLNAAAAASVTLDFDWLHAKALYTNNQTAESMFGVPLRGIGPFAAKLAILAAVALLVRRVGSLAERVASRRPA